MNNGVKGKYEVLLNFFRRKKRIPQKKEMKHVSMD